MLAVLLLTWVCSWSLAVPVVHADTNVTGQVSAIIARVPNSLGGGRNLAVIKDGDKPPVGTSQSSRQYDSWDGANGASEDWVGYTFSSARTFSRVVFQEGMHFWDGGWFQSLTVQVRQNGTWVSVQGLGISPAYAGNGGGSFQTYTLTFTQSWGDGIRIFGAPGGSAAFISVGELEVYEADGAAGSGGTGSAGTLTGASVTSQSSATIARVPNPLGGGASLAVIKDGIKAPAGSTDSGRQYDSWDGANFASEDWVGYTFSGSREFTGVVFQEGKHFWDGGWFLSLTVQVRQNGSWVGVQGLGISPAYAGNGGGTYQTYTMTFSPISGDGIRIFGEPGGSAAFISVGELDVYASGSSSGSTTSGSSSPPPPSSGPVFYTATDGNDANSGSETAPFRTVSKGVSKLTPGATLYVKAGTYAEALIHNIPRGNSWSQPVTVAAYPGHSVTLQPPSGKAAVLRFVGPQSYIVVRGFILDAANVQYDAVKITHSSYSGAAHHIRIQDCEIKNAPQMGILTSLGANSNEFVGLSVHDNGQTDFHHGIYL
ncbi:MAG TPA: discoidin domain-containing protein, partial [Methylomirabilota bacterium]|nr:discoidin domain-containing protein [Methylomirabilota bacterium]